MSDESSNERAMREAMLKDSEWYSREGLARARWLHLEAKAAEERGRADDALVKKTREEREASMPPHDPFAGYRPQDRENLLKGWAEYDARQAQKAREMAEQARRSSR